MYPFDGEPIVHPPDQRENNNIISKKKKRFLDIAKKMALLVYEKNMAYGDSFLKLANF